MNYDLAIGIDIGGTNIKVGVVNTQGQLLELASYPTPKTSATDIINSVTDIIIEKEALYKKHLLVGIGVPGVCDTANNEVIITPNLVSKDFPLRQGIEKAIKKKIAMDNDANMAALGEWWKGAGRGYRHMLLLTLGTGVGAGIIIEGRLFKGSRGWAGEIGHTIVYPGGGSYSCGKPGCLEAYASASAISRRFSALGNLGIDAEMVFKEARSNNVLAQKIINEAIEALSIGIYNYVLIFNPEAVIIGGGMVKAGERLLLPLKNKVFEMLAVYPGKIDLEIKPAEMENKAGILGAAKSVFDMYNII